MTATKTLDGFLSYECNRDGKSEAYIQHYREAFNFLSSLDYRDMTDIELEYTLMHLAYVVDPANEFKDNRNIAKDRYVKFIDHVSLMRESDIRVWCKQLHDMQFWRIANRRITNLVFNWLSGSLSRPESFL